MIVGKPSSLDIAQGAGAALAIAGLALLVSLGWVLLIVGSALLGVAVLAEVRKLRDPAPPTPAPSPRPESD